MASFFCKAFVILNNKLEIHSGPYWIKHTKPYLKTSYTLTTNTLNSKKTHLFYYKIIYICICIYLFILSFYYIALFRLSTRYSDIVSYKKCKKCEPLLPAKAVIACFACIVFSLCDMFRWLLKKFFFLFGYKICRKISKVSPIEVF